MKMLSIELLCKKRTWKQNIRDNAQTPEINLNLEVSLAEMSSPQNGQDNPRPAGVTFPFARKWTPRTL